MTEEGWYSDPYRAHEQRWFSDETPTALVRDPGATLKDPPPDNPYKMTAPDHEAGDAEYPVVPSACSFSGKANAVGRSDRCRSGDLFAGGNRQHQRSDLCEIVAREADPGFPGHYQHQRSTQLHGRTGPSGEPVHVPYTRRLTRFAQTHHLALFGSEATVQHFQRAGLPYDFESLMTALYFPRSGADLRGTVFLGATAASDFGVTGVDSSIIGSQTGTIVLAAKHTTIGWLAEWNTVPLPDGRYGIGSVAYDTAGHKTESDAVVVQVQN